MRREYQKPEMEFISLITEEKITNDTMLTGDDYVDGETGIESSIF